MNSKVIAVIAVVIIAVAAVGVYFLTQPGNQPAPQSNVYVLKDNVVAGDNISLDIGINATNVTEETDIEPEILLAALYRSEELGQKIGTKEITYDGRTLTLDIYDYSGLGIASSKIYVDPATYIVYKTETTFGIMSIVSELISTNLDLTIAIEDQEVVNGSYVRHSLDIVSDSEEVTLGITEILNQEVAYHLDGDTWALITTKHDVGTASFTETVKSVFEDQVIIEGNEDDPVSLTQFLSIISFKAFTAQIVEEGYNYTLSDRTMVSIQHPVYGKVDCIKQKIVFDRDGGESYEAEIIHAGDIIFEIDGYVPLQEVPAEDVPGYGAGDVKISLKNSSLVTQKN